MDADLTHAQPVASSPDVAAPRRTPTAATRRKAAMRAAVRRSLSVLGILGLLALPVAAIGSPVPEAAPVVPVEDAAVEDAPVVVAPVLADPPGLVFSAVDRATGDKAIYTADEDGSDVARVTPPDGRVYNWPRWAFGNTRIVYTVRSDDPATSEAIVMMNPDGTDVQVLQEFDFRIGQPSIDPTGRWIVFTGSAPWFPQFALFQMDLATGEAINLTAQTISVGGFDSDPTFTPGADGIVFVWTQTESGAAVAEMSPDGSSRHLITDSTWYDTDPSVSPDGSMIAAASYRGGGSPSPGAMDTDLTVTPADWHIVVQPRSGGEETVLTGGMDCTLRPTWDPCSVSEMSGFIPRFSSDGATVSFTGALDSEHTCICSIGVDGSDPRVIVSRSDLAIDWYDWLQPDGASTSTEIIGTEVRSSTLLLVAAFPDGTRHLMSASTDLMHRTEIALPDGLQPLEAHRGPDANTIVFTAEVPVGSPQAPHPAAPAGETRRGHITVADIDPVAASRSPGSGGDADFDPNLAQRQVFLRSADGTVTQLTDPWIEDWRDGLADGDARANTNPVMTSDGRYVIVTNTSTTTGESFLLRLDLTTGAVLNLTNGTAGALPTDDSEASISPDGSQVAFSWTQGALRGVYVMDTATGTEVSAVTDDQVATSMPAWAPDGRSLVYVSESPTGAAVVRATLSSALTAQEETTVSDGSTPVYGPAVAPEGDLLVYLAPEGNVVGVHVASMDGQTAPRVLQADPVNSFLDVDWR